MERSAADLRDRYLALLAAGATPDDLWQLFAEHPWYQEELHVSARLALRQREAPVEWLKDVEHEALMLLARKLRRTPHLQIDAQMAQRTFAAWLRQIMRRDCQAVIRRLQRRTRSQRPVQPADRISAEETALLQEHIDLSALMQRLPPVQRSLLQLYSQGGTIAQIARQSGMRYERAYREFQQGLKTLRRWLDAEGR